MPERIATKAQYHRSEKHLLSEGTWLLVQLPHLPNNTTAVRRPPFVPVMNPYKTQ